MNHRDQNIHILFSFNVIIFQQQQQLRTMSLCRNCGTWQATHSLQSMKAFSKIAISNGVTEHKEKKSYFDKQHVEIDRVPDNFIGYQFLLLIPTIFFSLHSLFRRWLWIFISISQSLNKSLNWNRWRDQSQFHLKCDFFWPYLNIAISISVWVSIYHIELIHHLFFLYRQKFIMSNFLVHIQFSSYRKIACYPSPSTKKKLAEILFFQMRCSKRQVN